MSGEEEGEVRILVTMATEAAGTSPGGGEGGGGEEEGEEEEEERAMVEEREGGTLAETEKSISAAEV